jgi:hypothetical protein
MKDDRAVSLPLYSEKQQFPAWVLLGIIAIGFLPFIIDNVVHTLPFRLLTTSIIASILGGAFILVCNLRTELHADGIRYRFFPLHLHWHFIPKNDIAKIYIRKYSPFRDYGGWGIHWSLGGSKAYNTCGNMGVQVELVNGKRILFGTQKPEEWEKVIKEMFADS